MYNNSFPALALHVLADNDFEVWLVPEQLSIIGLFISVLFILFYFIYSFYMLIGPHPVHSLKQSFLHLSFSPQNVGLPDEHPTLSHLICASATAFASNCPQNHSQMYFFFLTGQDSTPGITPVI